MGEGEPTRDQSSLIDLPRLTAWHGDAGELYCYSERS